MMSRKMYTIAEASDILGLAPTQIHYRIRTGKLKAKKLGWFWIISHEELDKLQEELSRATS